MGRPTMAPALLLLLPLLLLLLPGLGADDAADPPTVCADEFAKLCRASVRGDTSCDICTGQHQHQLRAASCRHKDLVALCAADGPSLLVLDEVTDDFALYYQASDSGVVAFYERSSGNLTLASCSAASCRTRAAWSVVHLATAYDSYFSAIDVTRLSDGRVLVVFIKDFPAAVRGLLCADALCAAPVAVTISADDWNGAGDYVRVAVDRETVAVAYSDGFQDESGVKLATVPLARLGVDPFTSHSVFGECPNANGHSLQQHAFTAIAAGPQSNTQRAQDLPCYG